MRYEQVVSVEGLLSAWEVFRVGKRGSVEVQEFERSLEDHLFRLHWELMNDVYRHASYKQFRICDPKPRVIHKAEVRDRVVHHALCRVLVPLFEPSFIFDSYSCRVGKGTHAAVCRLEGFARRVSRNGMGPCWALKCDIRKFFDSINHDILLRLLRDRVHDVRIMRLIENIVGSFRPVDKFSRERERERVFKAFQLAT